MKVEWNTSTHPISDVRDWSNDGRLELQPDFQRHEVWSKAAKIMLIDTILRNIPMPKIFLQSVLRRDHTYRIVLDGQQRLTAILGFLRGDFALESPYEGEYLSKRFEDLPADVQEDILSYKIDFNEISGATKDVIRDVYSRVNKYTVQLTKQELRRADFPGAFLNQAEILAADRFFEKHHVFTVANSRRMGDVEFVSELLAMLIDGPQEKKDSLDSFYLRYSKWDDADRKAVVARFKAGIDDITSIWDSLGGNVPFGKTRYRQKADLYALFNAIDDMHLAGGTLEGRPLSPLGKDLLILDRLIEPESEVQLLQKYAIQCVSQSNTIGSRLWRRELLKDFLAGTYLQKVPTCEIAAEYHDIIVQGYKAFDEKVCPICGAWHVQGQVSSDHVKIAWKKDAEVFQLSNASLIHCRCMSDALHGEYIDVGNYQTSANKDL